MSKETDDSIFSDDSDHHLDQEFKDLLSCRDSVIFSICAKFNVSRVNSQVTWDKIQVVVSAI